MPMLRQGLRDSIPSQRPVGWGTAIKPLSTVILATGVAFVLSMDKPSDLDARFGMGVGALFAVAASAFIGTGLQDRPLVLDSPAAVALRLGRVGDRQCAVR